jgi:hypothetical protein
VHSPIDEHELGRTIVTELQLLNGVAGSTDLRWAFGLREWPGKIIPANEIQIGLAVHTLINRALWPRDQWSPLVELFTPLYRAQWCNDAIVHVLDNNPDGTPAPPWHGGNGRASASRSHGPSLHVYLDSRLYRWRAADPSTPDDSADPPTAPLQGCTFVDWANRMNAAQARQTH